MGEESHTGVCSRGWWNPTRGGFDRPLTLSSAAAVCCSAAVGDVGSFRWTTDMLEIRARSGEESAASVSGSTVVFHGSPTAHASDSMAGDGFLMEPTVPVASSSLSFPSMDWSQVFISSNRAEGDFHTLLPDQRSSRAYIFQETSMGSDQVVHLGTANSLNPFRRFNQEFTAEKSHLSPGDSSGGESGSFHGDFLACSPTLLQCPLHQDVKPQNSYFNTSSTNFMSPEGFCLSSDESPRFPQFLKTSPSRQQPASGHHQFSDDTHFWNAMGGTGDSAGSNFRSTTQMNDQVFTQQELGEKPNLSTITRKDSSEAAREFGSTTAMAATATKKSVSEPAFKRPRIETPSPLPTFKVRKEKLGDRITALQQLVSPFGKTDTASVLHEAIEYIKFLHEQVGALSGPFLKHGSPMLCQQNSDKSKDDDGPKQQDLKSRGLCLVPISFTFPVVNEPAVADFWTPNFGGTYIG